MQEEKNTQQSVDAADLLEQEVEKYSRQHAEQLRAKEKTHRSKRIALICTAAAILAGGIGGAVWGWSRYITKPDDASSAADSQSEGQPIMGGNSQQSSESSESLAGGTENSGADSVILSQDGANGDKQEGYLVYLKDNALWYRDLAEEEPRKISQRVLSSDQAYDIQSAGSIVAQYVCVLPDKSGVFYPSDISAEIETDDGIILSESISVGASWDRVTIAYQSLLRPDESPYILDSGVRDYEVLADCSGVFYIKKQSEKSNILTLYYSDLQQRIKLSEKAQSFVISKDQSRIGVLDSDKTFSVRDVHHPDKILWQFSDCNAVYAVNDALTEVTYENTTKQYLMRAREGEEPQVIVDCMISGIEMMADDGTFYYRTEKKRSNVDGVTADRLVTPSAYADDSGQPEIADGKHLYEIETYIDCVDDPLAESDKTVHADDRADEAYRMRDSIRAFLRDTTFTRLSALWYYDGTQSHLISRCMIDEGIAIKEKNRLMIVENNESVSVSMSDLTDMMEASAARGEAWREMRGKLLGDYFLYAFDQGSSYVMLDGGKRVPMEMEKQPNSIADLISMDEFEYVATDGIENEDRLICGVSEQYIMNDTVIMEDGEVKHEDAPLTLSKIMTLPQNGCGTPKVYTERGISLLGTVNREPLYMALNEARDEKQLWCGDEMIWSEKLDKPITTWEELWNYGSAYLCPIWNDGSEPELFFCPNNTYYDSSIGGRVLRLVQGKEEILVRNVVPQQSMNNYDWLLLTDTVSYQNEDSMTCITPGELQLLHGTEFITIDRGVQWVVATDAVVPETDRVMRDGETYDMW